MDTLVLTTLLIDALGLVTIVVGLTVGTLLPNRHKTHPWVSADEVEQRRAA